MISLWKESSYKSNIPYILDAVISEYDISKANISVLRDAGVLSEESYSYFLTCPKLEREIAIGKLQGRDSSVTQILKDGISNARKVFMESNNIDDRDILSIRNDAITVINKKPKNLSITDRVKFRLSGEYCSYYKIFNIELFYLYDRIRNIEVLDNKGLGEQSTELHRNFMLNFLNELFYSVQIEGLKTAINLLQTVYMNYVNRKMEVGFYREFNSNSYYRLNKEFSSVSSLFLEEASEYDKRFIDISYNESVLRELNRYLSTEFFKIRR